MMRATERAAEFFLDLFLRCGFCSAPGNGFILAGIRIAPDEGEDNLGDHYYEYVNGRGKP
ncbi:MAG: hypothetical protein ACYST6_05865 [Planctomycetota bacterium]|jgi:hypothetical protein